jgi:Zn-dependent protease with chaperone function
VTLSYNALLRHQERQADRLAMDVLESNKGAINFFEPIKGRTVNKPTHPPLTKHLADAIA